MQLVHCLITELLGLRRIPVNVGRYAVLVIKNPKSVKPQTQATQTFLIPQCWQYMHSITTQARITLTL